MQGSFQAKVVIPNSVVHTQKSQGDASQRRTNFSTQHLNGKQLISKLTNKTLIKQDQTNSEVMETEQSLQSMRPFTKTGAQPLEKHT